MHVEEGAIEITTSQTGRMRLRMITAQIGRLENYICSGLLSLAILRNDHSFFTEFSHKRSILLREEYR